jgi:hypothetical protein
MEGPTFCEFYLQELNQILTVNPENPLMLLAGGGGK